MTTILDSLVVELKLDSGDFADDIKGIDTLTKGLTDSLNQLQASFDRIKLTFNQSTSSTTKVNESLNSNSASVKKNADSVNDLNVKVAQNNAETAKQNEHIKKQNEGVTSLVKNLTLYGIAAKTVSFAADFIGNTARAGTEIANLSDNLEESTRVMSAWGQVSKNLNNGKDSTAALFDKFHSMRTDILLRGSSPLMNLLMKEQIPTIDLTTGKLREASEVFIELSRKLQTLPRNEAYNYAKAVGGLDDYNANLLISASNLEQMIKLQEKHIALTDEEGKSAQKLTREMQQSWNILEKIGRNLLFQGEGDGAAGMLRSTLESIERVTEKRDAQGKSTDEEIKRLDAIEGGDYGAQVYGSKSLFYSPPSLREWDSDSPLRELNSDTVSHDSVIGLPNTRGFRNNNPGNLNFVGQTGASLESGSDARFAKFNNLQDGLTALAAQLKRYQDVYHLDSISDIISQKYAPKKDHNNTDAYIADLVTRTGFGAQQKLNLHDPATLMALSKAIVAHENRGAKVPDSMLQKAASNATTVNINSVTVNTQSKDAPGIANEFANHWTQAAQLAGGVN